MSPTRRLLCLASAALAGALALSALVVAPLVFQVFPDDHARAGALAGRVFEASYWCAIAVGAVIVLMGVPRRARLTLSALLLVVLGGVQVGLLAPMIAARGEGWPFSFAALHASAGALHLVLLLIALCLGWMLSVPAGAGAPLS